MLASPSKEATNPRYEDEDLVTMSAWISREATLASPTATAFSEVGFTDFDQLSPHTSAGIIYDCTSFTVSLCGRFLLAALGRAVYVYELNHVCRGHGRAGLPPGVLRPVTLIVCDKRVLSCSMDTSKGRNSVAILMEGRLGFLCDIAPQRLGIPASDSSGFAWSDLGLAQELADDAAVRQTLLPSSCICRTEPVTRAPAVETNAASVYRSICFPDDPPRSVALHPQRHCVAFGCAGGIELYWTDAVRGTHLSRWFSLASPSDYLYFMPPRPGIDTPKRLRLIGSAMALDSPEESFGNIIHGLNPAVLGARSAASPLPLASASSSSSPVMTPAHGYSDAASTSSTATDTTGTPSASEERLRGLLHRHDEHERHAQGWSQSAPVTSRNVYHYRAVPLSDGHHILFTDP